MSEPADAAFTAFHAADRLRAKASSPWEVFGERIRRFEVHLNGRRVEMRRGPIELEGYSVRRFQRIDDQLGVGFSASTDLSDAGVLEALRRAEETAGYSRFPARRVELPGSSGHPAIVEVVDREIWDRPHEGMDRAVHALLGGFSEAGAVQPSFGSVRLTLTEVTLTNSEGLHRRYPHTLMDLEFAVKASGGPEGRAPGEYWVNLRGRSLPSDREIARSCLEWSKRSQDVRVAKAPQSGPTRVVLPTAVLSDILPPIVGYRMSGAAQLRKMSPPAGTTVGGPEVTITDDGLLPGALGTAPCDDEGTTQSRRALVESGVARSILYDLLHGSALGEPTSGNGRRASALFPSWFHFPSSTQPGSTTIVVSPGAGGTDQELIEACGDGIWIDQLGYAFPDPVSGAFGGELRCAYRIRGGKLAEPLRGGTFGGVVFGSPGEVSLLSAVKGIGSHPTLWGNLSSASLLVDGMSVAGA